MYSIIGYSGEAQRDSKIQDHFDYLRRKIDLEKTYELANKSHESDLNLGIRPQPLALVSETALKDIEGQAEQEVQNILNRSFNSADAVWIMKQLREKGDLITFSELGREFLAKIAPRRGHITREGLMDYWEKTKKRSTLEGLKSFFHETLATLKDTPIPPVDKSKIETVLKDMNESKDMQGIALVENVLSETPIGQSPIKALTVAIGEDIKQRIASAPVSPEQKEMVNEAIKATIDMKDVIEMNKLRRESLRGLSTEEIARSPVYKITPDQQITALALADNAIRALDRFIDSEDDQKSKEGILLNTLTKITQTWADQLGSADSKVSTNLRPIKKDIFSIYAEVKKPRDFRQSTAEMLRGELNDKIRAINITRPENQLRALSSLPGSAETAIAESSVRSSSVADSAGSGLLSRFDMLRGIIMAGNDNKDILREFRALLPSQRISQAEKAHIIKLIDSIV